MQLKVIWDKATRPPEQAHKVEEMYSERLLDLFGTVADAYKSKEQWHRAYEPPIHHWPTYNKIAFLSACIGLSPSERAAAHFITRFEND